MGRFTALGKFADSIIGKKIAGVLTKPLKRAVRALDVSDFRTLKAAERAGDQLEHHHIPSFAALKKWAEQRKGAELTKAELDELYRNASTIELPKGVHGRTRTYGSRNTVQQIADDALDLARAAHLDYADTRKALLDAGYNARDVDTALAALQRLNAFRGIHP